MIKPWTETRGPILATSLDIEKAEAIAALLTRPIGLLPRTEGDQIKPFAIGIWDDFRELRIPNTSASPLRRALGAYLHSKRYLFACAQPDAFRHTIDGDPLEPVSEQDQFAAREAFLKLKNSTASPLTAIPEAPAAEPEQTKLSLIRAALLRPRKTA
ncbi:ProQ/FinO family protein [Rhizobium sp. VS19-DR104.2]|uniref:ProQ/FINO family protein n=1 Tax=unclassified Rhizobium TaxID=2613769 RepID=UPI001CC4B658|nr:MULTISPECIES: ProQ/FINO family protein [unclassified Rhizobium]MBZ5762274.1 ProQ/FinO family protein [Rhizobium sp. VS19-DR96]MBZ5768290.1 ProQ/FinO family protein [Rhizobium sp. VS19-DR129.2]MBZ5775838.1 ProQ/FinO family protein [Rhizobium sp. VS19-DRK62.2]MBZ5787141.1 ProQ/FinO family protein [Rhizobium sp. VS19-DR121]MBZ5804216.1 ProQ/FinO family protein [Rhizobium sp. VS19-DR181]